MKTIILTFPRDLAALDAELFLSGMAFLGNALEVGRFQHIRKYNTIKVTTTDEKVYSAIRRKFSANVLVD